MKLAAAGPCLLFALVGCAEEDRSPARSTGGALPDGPRPNVVLISIDSLRADHLGCYGYERDTSPNIDALADEGVLFERAMSSTSWTLPAHAALFTGLPDSVHGVDRGSVRLAEGRATLAESLREAGYRTAGFWSGPYLHPHFGLDQGFDEWISCMTHEVTDDEELKRRTGGAGVAETSGKALRLSEEDITNPRVLAAVTDWLEAAPPEPFFLFVHMWDVHYDFIPPPPYDRLFDPDYDGPVDGRGLGQLEAVQRAVATRAGREHLVALYDGEIAWTDEHVGKLVDLLDGKGLTERTLLVVTADHGEEFFEHGHFGHRKTLYDESIAVPLVLRWPGTLPAGTRVDTLVGLTDLAPTILAATGTPGLDHVAGRSLLPGLTGGAPLPSTWVVSELARKDRTVVALRSPRWKVLFRRHNGRPIELYDLVADPDEHRNRLADAPELRAEAEAAVARTLRAFEELSDRHAIGAHEDDAVLPADVEQRLRELGYIGDGDG